ncbi:MAG TPA: adenylyltransferase/cytidyltransferase family protein [Verrucomicrobiae bacterium]|nr:adenylyltransferase/cytidyltransferase family protein [Verrucomicrobiae bacterium]
MKSLKNTILGSIYCCSLQTGYSPNPNTIISHLENKMELGKDFYLDKIIELEKNGYLRIIKNIYDEKSFDFRCQLTELGRSVIKVVFVGGVFDLLHPGHIHTLKSAKSLGDILVVVVATTSTALKIKKDRNIYHDEMQRRELVEALSFVDLSIVGKEGTLYDTVKFVKPDIIALGYDQSHNEKEIQKNCSNLGLNLEVIRLSSPIPKIKSTIIKKNLGNTFYDI